MGRIAGFGRHPVGLFTVPFYVAADRVGHRNANGTARQMVLKGGGQIMPYLFTGGELVSALDATVQQELEDGCLPMF